MSKNETLWIMPEDSDYPTKEAAKGLPLIPIRRKGWFFDLRGAPNSCVVFCDGKRVTWIKQFTLEADANSPVMKAYLEIFNPAVVGVVERDDVTTTLAGES